MLQLTKELLNDATAEFKVPSSTDGDVGGAVTVPTTVDAHVVAINSLVAKLAKLKQTTGEVEEEIGQRILAIKAAEPNKWEEIVKARCGLSRSRAFELMAIGNGTKTTEQTRRESNARKIEYRAVRSGTDEKELAATDAEIGELKAAYQRELADARAKIVELVKARERQVVRYENKFAELSDAHNLGSEREQLRNALGEIVELLTEMRGLMTHPVQHRSKIISKITEAEEIATSR